MKLSANKLIILILSSITSAVCFAVDDNAVPANANPGVVPPSGVTTPPQAAVTAIPMEADAVPPNALPAPNVDCTLTSQLADDGTAAFSQDRFVVKTPAFYYVCVSNNAKAGQKLTAVWVAVNTRDIMPNNQTLSSVATSAVKDAGPLTPWIATFKIGMPSKGWPVGEYKVVVLYNDEIIKSQDLAVTFNTQAW